MDLDLPAQIFHEASKLTNAYKMKHVKSKQKRCQIIPK